MMQAKSLTAILSDSYNGLPQEIWGSQCGCAIDFGACGTTVHRHHTAVRSVRDGNGEPHADGTREASGEILALMHSVPMSLKSPEPVCSTRARAYDARSDGERDNADQDFEPAGPGPSLRSPRVRAYHRCVTRDRCHHHCLSFRSVAATMRARCHERQTLQQSDRFSTGAKGERLRGSSKKFRA
jgi:hypothetical protein